MKRSKPRPYNGPPTDEEVTGVKLLTTREMAARLDTSTFSVTRYVREGKLKVAYQAPGVAGAYMFTEDEADRFKRARQAELDGTVTIDEAQRSLGVSRTTVYAAIRAGKLTAVKVNGRRRITHKSITEFGRERKATAAK